MPRISYKTCEPFRAWNRLEPRPRRYDFDRILKSEIHDPLWLLTRQWQFGEFKGEDTGSPIFAKVKVDKTKLLKYKLFQGEAHQYTGDEPLEAIVEKRSRQLGFRERIQAGNQWLKILNLHGEYYNQNKEQPSDPSYSANIYKAKSITEFQLEVPVIDDSNLEAHSQSAHLFSNRRMMNYVSTFAGKVPDGLKIYFNIKDNASGFSNNISEGAKHNQLISDTIDEFLAWFEALFPEIVEEENAWNSRQLEYQFECALPEKADDNTVLSAADYYNGRLDWYAFDVANNNTPNSELLGATIDQQNDLIDTEVISFIPTPVEFAGMPSNRFWEFEDGKTDFGDISTDTTDISKIVVVEFATMYGNNWFLVPYPITVGTLSNVRGIVVTDVFGQKTFVKPAIQGESDDWSGWGMFNLTTWDETKFEVNKADTRLFIPPAVAKVQESAPIEEVLFLRDETANMVWAIENKVQDLLGSGMDGHKAATEFLNFFEALPSSRQPDATEGAMLRYILSNTVPENWIPFISIHLEEQNRAVQLQRASMPRVSENEQVPIRPRTDILRYGFQYDKRLELAPYVNPRANVQQSPYFIHEEEIPRSGIKVIANFQRTRWYQGKIVHWLGYRKTLGRGEGNSGIQFDRVEFLPRKDS